MIDAYLDHLRIERRLSDHTLESYARDLRSLARFAASDGAAIEALDRRRLEAFVGQQRARGLSPRSVARTVAALRGFYRFLVLERRLARSPADDVLPPRAWPALPKFLSAEDVERLIAQPDTSVPLGDPRPRDDRSPVRDRDARVGAGGRSAPPTCTPTRIT